MAKRHYYSECHCGTTIVVTLDDYGQSESETLKQMPGIMVPGGKKEPLGCLCGAEKAVAVEITEAAFKALNALDL